jgi:hypothetical protein
MKRIIFGVSASFFATPASTSIYQYVCKDHGKPFTVKVDLERNTLSYRGFSFAIQDTEDCAKSGWHVEGGRNSFDFCTATQGNAYFQYGGEPDSAFYVSSDSATTRP